MKNGNNAFIWKSSLTRTNIPFSSLFYIRELNNLLIRSLMTRKRQIDKYIITIFRIKMNKKLFFNQFFYWLLLK